MERTKFFCKLINVTRLLYITASFCFLMTIFFGVTLYQEAEDDMNRAAVYAVVRGLPKIASVRIDGVPPATFDGFHVKAEDAVDNAEHDFPFADGIDYYGTAMRIETDGESYSVISAGRDGAFGTSDDFSITKPVSIVSTDE